MKKLFFSSLLVLLTMVGIVPRLAAQEEGTPQYGVELLTNIPPAATDFTGWVVTSERADCIPECSEGWFKTSYEESTISQTIDLAVQGYTPVAANTLFLYAATEYYVGQTGLCDGIAKMYVECLDVNNKVLATHSVLNRTGRFGKVDSTLVSDTMMIPANTTQLRYVLKGKDQPGWAGYYGPWFRNMSCKIFNAIHSDESIQVSVAEDVRDKITLSKTADFHYGDTITVSLVNSADSIIWLTAHDGLIINTNQVVCWGENVVIGVQLKQSAYNITCNGTHATITANPMQAGMGDTISLNCTMDERYIFQCYITNVQVTWIDANRFIMPEAPITVGNAAITPKSVPYFEGFENGQGCVVADWLQQSEYGDEFWLANSTNTDFNRTPYVGNWNATLHHSNTGWLFQALVLEAGENYVLSLYARQDNETTSSANITAALGTACSKDAMSTTLISATGLTNGDYQLLTDTFQVAETKAYVLGIKGYIIRPPYYISMDNILVSQEVYPASVDTLYFDVLTEDATRTALADLSLTAVDTKGNTKHTFDNLAENWVLDLVNHTATYIVADSLLPMGYFFADSTETIIVNLIDKHTVTATAENGSVIGAGTYDYGTEITLTAIANEGYFFLNWSDGTKGATYTFTLTQDTVLTAIFGQYGVELLTNIPPATTNFTGWTTSGSVQCSEGWFKTSHTEGTISQTIELAAHGYTPVADNTLSLYAATEYKVGWAIDKQDGIARMYVECLDADNNVLATNDVLNRTGKFGSVDPTRVCDMFSIPANTTQVRYVLIGQDQCHWAGYYGTWFRNMSCKVYDNTKFNESIQVSVAPELRDSITLSKTTDFHYGDTITISPTYSEHPILWWTVNEGKVINTNQVVCLGENIVISAHLKYPHAIMLNGTHATLAADKATASVGDTVTLSYTLDENSYWGNYTTDINVTWINANSFIMPDAPVTVGNTAIAPKSLPYFEGFENGNTQDAVVADWLQQSENGTNSWVANTSYTGYNRAPYAGSWNATLYGSNTDWLFQAFTLEAGKEYTFSMRARSYYTAKILVKLGNQANKDAMSVTIVPETTFSKTDYQCIGDKFTVETTGTYVIGIRGYSTNSSNYTSIDNIQVREAQSHTITCTGTHATLTADKIEAGMGDTVTLSYTLDENSYWGNYTTDIDVTWVDANRFIMPDENVAVGNTAITVKSLPYFEGFENGNTQDAVLADWFQQSENGDYSWVANSKNTSFNRTPYAGSSWNATLHYSNTDWLFQALALEAGENYVLSLYARQDYENTSYANITAALGTACHKDAMTTTLIPETGLTNGDYQLLTDTFQVAETKAYVLGIKGYINGTPYYISMDNILVEQEVYPASIATPVGVDGFTEDAARTALAALSLTAADTKGNTKCTITNLPENWVLDIENKKATYTVADNLLPMGYFFSNTTATITVALQLNTYSLSFATNDAAMGSVSSTHEADTYNYGTVITLTATADKHYHFVQWSDGATEATYTFTLTSDTTLTATFAIDQHTVTATAGENGTVKMEVNDVETTETVFDYGTEVTLTAIAEEGYHFVQWSNDTWANPYILTLTDDITLMAVFEKDPEYNAVGGFFSVGEGTQVQFSAGNLQYTQSAAMWSFAANQYDMLGTANEKNGALANKIDLFGWSGNTAIAKWGISTSTSTSAYSGDFADWGQNVGDGNTWRTLTKSEWDYLFDTRENAANLMGVAAIQITESEKAYGLILLPDNWKCPETVTFKSGFATKGAVEEFANYQTFTLVEWALLESAGAVFLPAAGTVYGLSDFREICRNGRYWSSTANSTSTAWYMSFYPDAKDRYHYERSWRLSVRLVQDYYTVTATCDEEQGSISGAGTYLKGTVVTLTATANTGYSFDKWSDDNTDNPRTITVTENVTLEAIFKQDAPTQLSETNAETKVEKVLRNGQVFIIRNGNTYDLTGRKAE